MTEITGRILEKVSLPENTIQTRFINKTGSSNKTIR